MKAPEHYKYPTKFQGVNGIYIIAHYRINNYEFRCVASDNEEGWEHVSVTINPCHKNATRCPTWEEMCFIKDQFWNDEEEVIQIHPKKSDYVNAYEFCLHLWRKIEQPA